MSEKLQEDLRKLIRAQEGTYEVSKESHIRKRASKVNANIISRKRINKG